MIAAVASAALIGAAPGSTQVSFTFGDADIGPVRIRGDVAKIDARSSCDVGSHIGTSVKQYGAAAIDPAVAAGGSGFGGSATTLVAEPPRQLHLRRQAPPPIEGTSRTWLRRWRRSG